MGRKKTIIDRKKYQNEQTFKYRRKSRFLFYKNEGWKTAKINKRVITPDGYYRLSFRNYSSGFYVSEHRYIMMKKLNRILKSNEFVHHKDGNRLNNSIENLEIMNGKEHYKCHYMGAIKENKSLKEEIKKLKKEIKNFNLKG